MSMTRNVAAALGALFALVATLTVGCSEEGGPLETAGTSLEAQSHTETCVVDDTSNDEVLPGVTLAWDSSFRCEGVPADTEVHQYEFTVSVTNDPSSGESVTIDAIDVVNTTPKPRGNSPVGDVDGTTLPITVGPGETASFDVTGSYSLVETDEGLKANLHLSAEGSGDASGEPFNLGINAHLRS